MMSRSAASAFHLGQLLEAANFGKEAQEANAEHHWHLRSEINAHAMHGV